jgi:hypothetical protein
MAIDPSFLVEILWFRISEVKISWFVEYSDTLSLGELRSFFLCDLRGQGKTGQCECVRARAECLSPKARDSDRHGGSDILLCSASLLKVWMELVKLILFPEPINILLYSFLLRNNTECWVFRSWLGWLCSILTLRFLLSNYFVICSEISKKDSLLQITCLCA